MKTTRNYQGKDVDMLTTCATIVENNCQSSIPRIKTEKLGRLIFRRFKNRMDNAFSNYFGVDNASDQMASANKSC